MRGFLRLGRITGIPVSIHWTLAVIAWFLGVGLATGALPASVPHAGTAAYWGTAAVGVVAFFGSVLVHELSHALVARRFGVSTEGIDLWLLGGHGPAGPGRAVTEGRRARSRPPGPASSVVLGAVFIAAAVGLGALGIWPLAAAMVAWLGVVNLIIAVFNLLPGAPLDGGRILRAVRWSRHHDRLRATNEAAQAGQVLGWAIVIFGVWALFHGLGRVLPAADRRVPRHQRQGRAAGGRLRSPARWRDRGRRHLVRRGRGVGRHRRRDDARSAGPARPAPCGCRAGRPRRPDRAGGRGPAVVGARAAAPRHPPRAAHRAVQPHGQGRAARGTGASAGPGHAPRRRSSPSGGRTGWSGWSPGRRCSAGSRPSRA